MTILETMAYGIPNITTDVAAIPEAVNAGNGILIHPGDKAALKDAITAIANDREKRASLSEAAYETALDRFSIEKHIEHILKIYREMEKEK